jgi:hypothetical protein
MDLALISVSINRRTRREKINTFVDFPISDLDLTSYIPHKRAPPPPSSLGAMSNSATDSKGISSSSGSNSSGSSIGSSGSSETKTPFMGVAPEIYDLFGTVV